MKQDPQAPERVTRRQFLRLAGLGAASLGLMPRWLQRASAAVRESSPKTLIVLFQRGAADGLNIAAPCFDPTYRRCRPSIAIEPPMRRNATLDLDGRFGLHPGLSALAPMWREKRFALVHAVGSPDSSRSHERAQDLMEGGLFNGRIAADGWVNRAMDCDAAAARGVFEAVALSSRNVQPKSTAGPFPVLTMRRVAQFRFEQPVTDSFEALYEGADDALLAESVRRLAEARRILRRFPTFDDGEHAKRGYPRTPLGFDLFELAWLVKAGLGLRVGFAEMPAADWDNHFNEGSTDGRLADALSNLGDSIAAFYRDLGDKAEDVLLVTMTEFGRSLQENLTGGTDHGHASLMMLFGGRVRGGRVYGVWPGLEKENLFEGRDLKATTDFRQVLSEVLARHLAISDLARVFPGGPFEPLGLL